MKLLLKIFLILIIVVSLFKIGGYFMRRKTLINMGISFSHSGDGLLVSLNYPFRETGQIYLIDLEGNLKKRVTDNFRNNYSAAFSKTNQSVVYVERVFFSGTAPSRILSKNLKTNSFIEVSNAGFSDLEPSYSLDETKIVFRRSSKLGNEHMGFGQVWRGWDLYMYDVNAKVTTRLTSGNYYRSYSPQFISKDQKILFCLSSNDFIGVNKYIYQLDLRTKKQSRYLPFDITDFIVSHDGKWLLYEKQFHNSARQPVNKLVLRDVDSQKEQVIFVAKPWDEISDFSLSADNGKVAIVIGSGSDRFYLDYRLYLLDIQKHQMREIKFKKHGRIISRIFGGAINNR